VQSTIEQKKEEQENKWCTCCVEPVADAVETVVVEELFTMYGELRAMLEMVTFKRGRTGATGEVWVKVVLAKLNKIGVKMV
jgi:hypothetical protein